MKRTLAAVAFATIVSASQADVLAIWTFEVSVPTTAGPHNPETGSGQGTGFHASASTVYSNPVGNGSNESFSSNFWAAGDYYQFKVATTGYQNVMVTWDQTSSNTGPRDFNLQYSTDGSNFSNFSSYSVLANANPNNTWSSTTYHSEFTMSADLSSISGLNNQAAVYIRMTQVGTVSANGGTVATGGTNRIDNVTVEASLVPEPASLAVLGLGAFGLLRRRLK